MQVCGEMIRTEFSEEQNIKIYPDGVEHNFWHTARNRIILHYLAPYKAEPLLEIGAGRGIVLAALREAGWEAYGVDLTKARPIQPDLPIVYGADAFALKEEERKTYQSIGMFDVLEHLPERVQFLERIRCDFPNVKYLYITVPASPALWSNYDEYCGHYLRYTTEALEHELHQAGYHVLFSRYFFHSLWWAIRLTLLTSRKRAEEFKPPHGIKRLLHKIIGDAFYWEGRLLPGTWRGSSLLAVAAPIR